MSKQTRSRFSRVPYVVSGLIVLLVLALVTVSWSNGGRLPWLQYDRDLGNGVSVPRDAEPKELYTEISSEAPSIPDVKSGPVWVKRLTPVINIGPSGPLPKPVSFTIKLSEPLTDDDILFVRVNHSHPFDPKAWETVPAQLSKDKSQAVVTLDHLSAVDIYKLSKSVVLGLFNGFVEEAFAGAFSQTKPVKCQDKAKAEAGGQSFTVEPQMDPTHWCYGYFNKYNASIVKLANPHKYPIEVVDSKGFVVIDSGDVPVSMVQAHRLNHTVIMPRESMTFEVNPTMNPGTSRTLNARASNWGTGLTAVDAIAKAFLVLAGGLLGKSTEGALAALKSGRLTNLDDFGLRGVQLKEFMETIYDAQSCKTAMDTNEPNLTKVLNNCFDTASLMAAAGLVPFLPVLVALTAAIAAFVAISSVVFAIIDFPRVLSNFVGDKLSGKDKTKITATRKKADFAAFVGSWQRHYGTLAVRSDGTGTVTSSWNCPIGEIFSQTYHYCQEVAQFKLTGDVDGKLASAEFTRVGFTYDHSPVDKLPEGAYTDDPENLTKKGDRFKLRIEPGKRMTTVYEGRLAKLNHASEGITYCSPGVSDPEGACGA